MKIARATAAATLSLALTLVLGACSSDESIDAEPTTVDTSNETDDMATDDMATDSTDDGTTEESGVLGEDEDPSTDEGIADVAASCEEFNTLSADIRAVEPGDTTGYNDIYLRSQEAKMAAPDQEMTDVFAVMSLLALEAGSGDDTTETMTILGQAVLAAAGTCTAEGVTLTIS